jgi:glycosyltransferase involved in cell wall biosynthesis
MNKKPFNILLIYAKNSLELLNRQSALGSYIFCLCDLLEKDGMSVSINGKPFKELRNTVLKRSPAGVSAVSAFMKWIPKWLKDILKDMLVFKNVEYVLEKIGTNGDYDCILEFYNYGSDAGLKTADRLNIPLVVVYDAPVLEEHIFFHGEKLFFKKKILTRELKTLKKATSVVVYSNAVKKYINHLAGKNLNAFIHQNVDFTRFHFLDKQFDDTEIKIGFIGSFLKWHRIDLLVHAFNKLKEKGYAVKLYLIGYGMEFDQLQALVNTSLYKKDIVMTGFLDGEQLLEWKKQLHIGVMPGSNWYGAPNKIFEYGAAQMAVVAPGTPTIADLFKDKEEILLFRQDDAADLFQKLESVCTDRKLTETLAKKLQNKIRVTYSEKNTLAF